MLIAGVFTGLIGLFLGFALFTQFFQHATLGRIAGGVVVPVGLSVLVGLFAGTTGCLGSKKVLWFIAGVIMGVIGLYALLFGTFIS